MSGELRARLAGGERLTGTVLTMPGTAAAELVAEPLDVVWIDLEHAALGPAEAQEMIIGAQAGGAAALIRLPAAADGLITMMLDAGADGLVIASVDGAEAAARAVAATRYPPEGRRGYGLRRAGLKGRGGEAVRPPPTVWAQIETRAGVAHAGAIAAVDGIDAVVVGTADLSFALGVPLDMTAAPLLHAVAAVRGAVRARGTAFGLAGGLVGTSPALTAGAQVLVHSTDARLYAAAVDAAARRLQTVLSSSDEREPSTP